MYSKQSLPEQWSSAGVLCNLIPPSCQLVSFGASLFGWSGGRVLVVHIITFMETRSNSIKSKCGFFLPFSMVRLVNFSSPALTWLADCNPLKPLSRLVPIILGTVYLHPWDFPTLRIVTEAWLFYLMVIAMVIIVVVGDDYYCWYLFTQPLRHGQDVTQGQFLSFLFPLTVCLTEVKSLGQSHYLLRVSGGVINRFLTFPKSISGTQIASIKIRTHVTDSISIGEKIIFITQYRNCLWCNGYRRRKWTRRHEFKS